MTRRQFYLPAKPFFLDASPGSRFCLYYASNPAVECRGAIIYVHPFGEEMNKARRMAALQARTLSERGFAVLQIDLFGCGDSAGEFRDARWEIWKTDLIAAKKWLDAQHTVPISLWGLRLGALLALDFARTAESGVNRLLLWQPVLRGELFMTQFLRLRLAEEMLTLPEGKSAGTHELRNACKRGEILEIAGYEIAPELIVSIDSLDACKWEMGKKTIHWFEITSKPGQLMGPARAQIVSEWSQAGVALQVQYVQSLPFWATQEICENRELLDATVRILDGVQG